MRLGWSIRAGRRRVVAAAAAAAMTASLLAACAQQEQGVVINLYGGAAAAGFDKIIKECNDAAGGRYRIVGNLLPSDADGQREQLVRRLAAQDKGMDLLGMDVTWTAEFAEAGWINELSPEQIAAANDGTLAAAVETATWKGKQYGIPKHTNVQILWYRKSLVPTPPETYDQMMQMSQQLKDQGKPYEIGITASQYEGYVVNFNTLVTAFGGTIVNEDATKATLDDKSEQALALIKRLATSGLTSASMSNAQEPEIFADLQNDKSAFSVNWPYVGSAMQSANPEVAADLGFAPLPVINPGDPPIATLGGMNYAVSAYSEHPDEAYDAAMCLRSPEHQLQTALEAGDPPVHEPLYTSNAEFQESYPMYAVMLEQLQNAVPRPVTPMYQNISTVISNTLSPPGAIDPKASNQLLQENIQDAIDGKGILP